MVEKELYGILYGASQRGKTTRIKRFCVQLQQLGYLPI
jgi:hypothetical protein